MNLRKKLLLIMLVIIIIPIVIGVTITYFRMHGSIQSMEIDRGKKNLKSVESYLNLLIENHRGGHLTWTAWNEYYDAVKKHDIGWITENIVSTNEEDTSNEVLITLDQSGKAIASSEVPKDWKNADYAKFSVLKKLSSGSVCESGLMSTSEGLYIVSVVKLAKSDDSNFTNCNGYTIYARRIKAEGLLKAGKNLIDVKIAIQLNNKVLISTDRGYQSDIKSSDGLNSGKIVATERQTGSEFIVKSEGVLMDIADTPIGILSVETSNKTGKSALNQLGSSSVILVLILMIAVIVVSMVLIRIFIRPILFLTGLMNKLSKGDIEFSKEEMDRISRYKGKSV